MWAIDTCSLEIRTTRPSWATSSRLGLNFPFGLHMAVSACNPRAQETGREECFMSRPAWITVWDSVPLPHHETGFIYRETVRTWGETKKLEPQALRVWWSCCVFQDLRSAIPTQHLLKLHESFMLVLRQVLVCEILEQIHPPRAGPSRPLTFPGNEVLWNWEISGLGARLGWTG